MSLHSSQVLTTDAFEGAQSTEYWIEMICATFVRLTAQNKSQEPLSGAIHVERLADMEFSTVESHAQDVYRNRRMIANEQEDYVLMSIQQRGQGWLQQDGRKVDLQPGEMTLYDSTRPYSLHFRGPFQQLVVQVPKTRLGIDDTRTITALAHKNGSPGSVAAELLVSMNRHLQCGGEALAPLVDHVMATVRTAVQPVQASQWSTSERDLHDKAVAMMQMRLHRPGWGVAQLARECYVSERSLYRAFVDEPVGVVLRRLRIERAGGGCSLLIRS